MHQGPPSAAYARLHCYIEPCSKCLTPRKEQNAKICLIYYKCSSVTGHAPSPRIVQHKPRSLPSRTIPLSMAHINDADFDTFFDLCAASFEINAYTPSEPSPVAFLQLFGDGDQKNEACKSDYEDLPQSYLYDFGSRIPHSDEGTPASDWTSSTLGSPDSLSDAQALSINPSLLITAPDTPEHGLYEDPIIEDKPRCIAHSPPHISMSEDPSPSPLPSVKSISSDPPVVNICSSDSSEGSAEAVTASFGKEEVAAQRRRPRTRQHVRATRRSFGRDPGSDSEYLGSDPEESGDAEGGISSTSSSNGRRKTNMYLKPARRLRCEELFCNRSFTRPADLRRHIATVHENLSRVEVLKETREEYRLWCKKCEVILGRVDARQRHESHGSCQRSQAIMEARIRNGTVRGRASRGQLK
ncbi:hypothetical protein BS17DRAFT_430189 [Gyrodon lividus]|nr:hypothetical protein BS17DRAFT_430189 [Gyrodon lividus]